MKTGIFYFSREGSTKAAAEILAGKLDGDLIELKEDRKRHGFMQSGYRAITKKKGKLLGNPELRVVEFDRIVLGTPIWAGNGTPAINGFLDTADLTGKEVILFTVQADPRMENIGKTHDFLAGRIIAAGAGENIQRLAFHGSSPGKAASANHLREQIDKADLN